jgi:hypothetical protein
MAFPRRWRNSVQPNNATPVVAKAAVTGRTHYVTKVTLSFTTHVNAKFVQVDDGTKIPVKRTDLTAAAGVPDVIEVNFPLGFGMTLSAAVNVTSEAAGHSTGCWAYVEGFTI